MAIIKPTRYKTDTEGNAQQSIPLVIIYKTINTTNINEIDNTEDIDKIFLSTNNITFDGNYYKPILTKTPPYKQSIDTDNKQFRLQNVKLDINNTEFHGESFSESVNKLINCVVRIYFKTQSSKTIDDCMLVSQLVITKFVQQKNIVQLETEDFTQKLLDKKIPELIEGTDYAFTDQARPMPIVYGHVTKSPTRKNINPFESDSEGNEVVMALECDSKPIHSILAETDTESYPMVNVGDSAFSELFYNSPVYIHDENYLNILNKVPIDYEAIIEQETTINLNMNATFFEKSNSRVLVTEEYFKFQQALKESESLGGLDLDSAIISRIYRKFTDVSGQKRAVRAERGDDNITEFIGRLYATTSTLDDDVFDGTSYYPPMKWDRALFDEENYQLQTEARFPFESDSMTTFGFQLDDGLNTTGFEEDEVESILFKNWNVPKEDGSFSVFNLSPKNYLNYIYHDDSKSLGWFGYGHSNFQSQGSYVNWDFILDDIGIDNKCITKLYFDIYHYQNENIDYGTEDFDEWLSGSIFWSSQIPQATSLRFDSIDNEWGDKEGQNDWRISWNTFAPVEGNNIGNINVTTEKVNGYNNIIQTTSTKLNRDGAVAPEWATVSQFKNIKIGQPQYIEAEGFDSIQHTVGALNYLHIVQDAFIEKPNEKDWYVNVKGRVDDINIWTPFNSFETNTFTTDELNNILTNTNTYSVARTTIQGLGYRYDFGSSNDTSGGESGWLINCNPDMTVDDFINNIEFENAPEWIWIYTHYNKISEYHNLERTTTNNEVIKENKPFIIYTSEPFRINSYTFKYKFIRMNHIVGTLNDWEQGFTPEESQTQIQTKYINNGWSPRVYTEEIVNLLETPELIFKHLLENETDINTNSFDEESIHQSLARHQGWKLGFTLNEQIKVKELIQEISKNTKLYPRFTSDGQFNFTSENSFYNMKDVNFHITKNDVIDYKFDITKVEDVYNTHEVAYEFDYANEEYNKVSKRNTIQTKNRLFKDYNEITEYLYGSMQNMPENWLYDANKLYNINIDDSVNEFEAKYIRNSYTVELLKKHMLMDKINQHLLIDLTLTNKYNNIEVGDVLYIDQLSDKKGLGYKYWAYEVKGGQLLYPFYFVTDVNKTNNKVQVKLKRLHRLQYGLPSWLIFNNNLDSNYILPDTYESISQITEYGTIRNYVGVDVEEQFLPPIKSSEEINNEFRCEWYLDNFVLPKIQESAIRLEVLQTKLYDVDSQNWTVQYQEKIDGVWQDYEIETNSFEFIVYANPDNNYNGYVIVKPKQENNTDSLIRGRIIITTNLGERIYKAFHQDFVESSEDILIGDINQDSIINVLDIVRLVDIILLQDATEGELIRADVNGDGGVNVLDIVGLANLILET